MYFKILLRFVEPNQNTPSDNIVHFFLFFLLLDKRAVWQLLAGP
jgi:hypothetical protein